MSAVNRESEMVTLSWAADGTPTVWCDPCIVDLVAALNEAGLETVASCCGHGSLWGIVSLRDGRELVVGPLDAIGHTCAEGKAADETRAVRRAQKLAYYELAPAPVAPKVCATCGAPFDQYERSFLAPDSCINGHQRPSCAAGPENPEEES